jgi:hypothetical protein
VETFSTHSYFGIRWSSGQPQASKVSSPVRRTRAQWIGGWEKDTVLLPSIIEHGFLDSVTHIRVTISSEKTNIRTPHLTLCPNVPTVQHRYGAVIYICIYVFFYWCLQAPFFIATISDKKYSTFIWPEPHSSHTGLLLEHENKVSFRKVVFVRTIDNIEKKSLPAELGLPQPFDANPRAVHRNAMALQCCRNPVRSFPEFVLSGHIA